MGRFRFFAQRDTDPGHPSDGIERQRRLRHRREILGIYLDLDQGIVQGSRVASIGSGRWSRFESVHSQAASIPETLLAPFQASAHNSSKTSIAAEVSSKSLAISASAHTNKRRTSALTIQDLLAAQTDLADWLSHLVNSWARQSGSSDEELLCIAVHDSGWCWPDFDGAIRWISPIDAPHLAERCGWPVLCDFRASDVAAGGRGDPLDPLPHWFLLADRNERVAQSCRITARLDRESHLLYLPASDGLDAQHPMIQRVSLEAWSETIATLARVMPGRPHLEQLGTLAVQGKVIPQLRTWLEQFKSGSTIETLEEAAGRLQVSTADVARTALDWLVDQIAMLALRSKNEAEATDRVIVIGAGATAGYLKHAMSRVSIAGSEPLSISSLEEQASWDSRHWDATLTATLGFMHVDQQPTSLPWLTGADVPRLHGRLVPGHLAPWRRLLVEMADFRPPPMKLREAV